MPVRVKKIQQINNGEMKGGPIPWFDYVEQHGVCNALPYFESIRTFELGYPDRVEVIQCICIPA